MIRLSSGETILGISEPFKVKKNLLVIRNKRLTKTSALHLGKAKPEIQIMLVDFEAMFNGTVVEVGEFKYKSSDGILEITNTEAGIGITLDPADTYEIPIEFIPKLERVISNVYTMPVNT